MLNVAVPSRTKVGIEMYVLIIGPWQLTVPSRTKVRIEIDIKFLVKFDTQKSLLVRRWGLKFCRLSWSASVSASPFSYEGEDWNHFCHKIGNYQSSPFSYEGVDWNPVFGCTKAHYLSPFLYEGVDWNMQMADMLGIKDRATFRTRCGLKTSDVWQWESCGRSLLVRGCRLKSCRP